MTYLAKTDLVIYTMGVMLEIRTLEIPKPIPTRKRWCTGLEIPVEVHIWRDSASITRLTDGRIFAGSTIGEIKYGTVVALKPEVIKAGSPQGHGLFLDGPVIGRGDIRRVITVEGGVNVTKFIKMSFGPGL